MSYSSETTLVNIQNYTVYKDLVNGGNVVIHSADINTMNYKDYYDGLLNIFKDGIETDQVQSAMFTIVFPNGMDVQLSLFDYWFNLVMWYLVIRAGRQIQANDLIFEKEITQDTIKKYIDEKLIDPYRRVFTNMELNNIIDDTLIKFHDLDLFAFYLSNTVNLEDTAKLMSELPEFWDCMHADLSNIPIEQVKEVGNRYSDRSIEIIKNEARAVLGYDHCLADAFRASEGINPKQYREFNVNIGIKPDGNGSVFPVIVNNSFINGGVSEPQNYFIESSVARIAQIIKFNNVGTSGHFARLLGLNNMDSELYPDHNYDCHSHNYLIVYVKNSKILYFLNNKYYRLHPDGMEYLLKSNRDKHLIGQTLYLRSPITCASAARGQGVCYKCYGDLAYTVHNFQTHMGVNIGRIASELLSAKLTQMQISAKHILEAAVKALRWSDDFDKFFVVEYNIIELIPDIDTKHMKILIDPDNIELENEEDEDLSSDEGTSGMIYNEYITEFEVINEKTGETYHIYTEGMEKLYFTNEFNTVIRKKAEPISGKISIGFEDVTEEPLFIISIQNNELSRILNLLKDLLNNSKSVKGKTINQLYQEIIEVVDEGKLNVTSPHIEVILSNQIRDIDNILEKPDWSMKDPPYQILTLNKALTDNPSVIVSLSYQKINKALCDPLTYRKHKPSFMDLFFMKQPQMVLRNIQEPVVEYERNPDGTIDPLDYRDISETTEDVDVDIDEIEEDLANKRSTSGEISLSEEDD